MSWRFLVVLLALALPIFSQSIDEEESVSLGGAGSGNGDPDDEDLQGSGLPPDLSYATTPSLVHPKFTSRVPEETTQTVVKSVSTVVTQRHKTVVYPSTTTPRVTTRPVDSSEIAGWGENSSLVILLLCLIISLVLLIVAVLVCRSCNNKKQAYRPGVREQSANGLLSKTDY